MVFNLDLKKSTYKIDSNRLYIGKFVDDFNKKKQEKACIFYPYYQKYLIKENENKLYILFCDEDEIERRLRLFYERSLISFDQYRFISSSLFIVDIDDQSRILLPKITKLNKSKEVIIIPHNFGLEIILDT